MRHAMTARTVSGPTRHCRAAAWCKSRSIPKVPRVCHSVVLHPPGGIAGGDRLELESIVARRSCTRGDHHAGRRQVVSLERARPRSARRAAWWTMTRAGMAAAGNHRLRRRRHAVAPSRRYLGCGRALHRLGDHVSRPHCVRRALRQRARPAAAPKLRKTAGRCGAIHA